MERKCQNKNCCKDITEMRVNAKYCYRNCKSIDRKMRKYWELKKIKGIEEQLKLVEDIKKIKKLIENINGEE